MPNENEKLKQEMAILKEKQRILDEMTDAISKGEMRFRDEKSGLKLLEIIKNETL